MKQKSLKINALWNLLYSGSNLVFPLVTAPYVSRVLGASNLGEVDFAKSFVQWFMIFAAFGVTTYGVRAISQSQNDQNEMNKVFSELFLINFLFSVIATGCYFILILNNNSFLIELPLFIMMSFSIVLNVVNIDWFYQGIEEYSYITIRNGVIKIISLILILVFIKNPEDYIIYGFISVMGVSLSGFFNVINSRKYVKFSFRKLNLTRHLKQMGTFYVITFVINLYTNLDRTMLGFLDTSTSVAFLSRGKMVTGVATTISTSMSSVAMPRASYYLKEDFAKYKKLVKTVPNYMMILTIPIAFGIAILSTEIMHILGGTEFTLASNLLSVIAFSIIFSTLSTFLQNQVLLPTGNEKLGLLASVGSSFISLGANFILIPKYSYLGAGIALLLAEIFAFLSRYILIRYHGMNYVEIMNKSVIKYIFSSFIMVLSVLMVKQVITNMLLSFTLSAIIGSITYFLLLILLKENIITKQIISIKLRFNSKAK